MIAFSLPVLSFLLSVSPFFDWAAYDTNFVDVELHSDRIEARPINPNYATLEELAQLPFMSDALISAIISQRNLLHFKDMDDFRTRLGLSDQFASLLSPYLTFAAPSVRWIRMRTKMKLPDEFWSFSLWGGTEKLGLGFSLRDSIFYGIARYKFEKGELAFGKMKISNRLTLEPFAPLRLCNLSYFGETALHLNYSWASAFLSKQHVGLYLKGKSFGTLLEFTDGELERIGVLSVWKARVVTGGAFVSVHRDKINFQMLVSGREGPIDFYTFLNLPRMRSYFRLSLMPEFAPIIVSVSNGKTTKLKLSYRLAPRRWFLLSLYRGKTYRSLRFGFTTPQGLGFHFEQKKDTSGKSASLLFAQLSEGNWSIRFYSFHISGMNVGIYETSGFRFNAKQSGSRLCVSLNGRGDFWGWSASVGLTRFLGEQKPIPDFGFRLWYRYEKVVEN